MADLYPVDPILAKDAHVTHADYNTLYQESLEQPEAFWSRIAQRLEWFKVPTRIKDVSYQLEDFHIRWFDDGELNASINCLDRHLPLRGDKTALLFEPDAPDTPSYRMTYRELYERVCQ
ncbi:MAG TPA: acetyl-coenzyme A synthetase N-terminal domain-containing protein, partial [Xylella sp.]